MLDLDRKIIEAGYRIWNYEPTEIEHFVVKKACEDYYH